MKKILSVIVVFLLLVSCKEDVVAKPDRLIAKDKMIDIMYDIAVLEGIKYQNPTSLDSNQINSASYIYKKYNIDSLQLAQSNVYYATDYVEYKNMYDTLVKRIDRKKADLDSIIQKDKKLKSKREAIKAKKAKATLKKDSLAKIKVAPINENITKGVILKTK
ncbi:DUF4296 domain-containing protein [Flavobacterium sp.]|uniref:DUF4296 domain-containing protein n=1 Tax=Flavobacterium sp. TaxID=239 RepID=UPI002604B112|nr:DUF4296 domain-containing protein [Flavobacterium sp.]MDG2433385.1 DUF4296 domain-containing protein [Flavobacterium sp.]